MMYKSTARPKGSSAATPSPLHSSRNQAANRRHLLAAVAGIVLALASGSPQTAAQASHGFDPFQVNQRFPDKTVFMTPDEGDMQGEAKRVRLLNAVRQRAMVQDVEKLLKLANQLNSNSADGVPLTAWQRARKADEIEKLARDVKDKMIFVFTAEPGPQTPLGAWPQ